ncbi:MAG: hypothetical protein JXA71_02465 [Chitinispirillaceae bacterium]|nr:hypothetical protein [Chitinispirillaceae bacterium]
MRKRINVWKQGLSTVAATFAVATVAFAIEAQDGCTSFGWANYDGQSAKGPVTGGGTAAPTQVTTFAALKSAIESSDARVIYVMNDMGNGYSGTSGDVLKPKSNKTVIGYRPGITVKCSWQISGASNLIVKNLICRGPGNSNSEQNWDVVNIQSSSKRIWFDHCTIMEGEDGNFDFVKGSDNLTVTWCKFTYVTGGEHNFSNLIGSSDNESESHGKLNATFAYCWWENVNSRCPRTRYGKIHVLNCYYNKVGSGAFAGFMSNIRVEGSYFESNVTSPTGLISTGGQSGVFTIDCNVNGTKTDGYTTAFTPPYQYKKYGNAEVKTLVTGRAGPTLTGPNDCGGTVGVVSPQRFSTAPALISVPARVSGTIRVTYWAQQGEEVRMSLLSLAGRTIAEKKSICNRTGCAAETMDEKTARPGVYVFTLRKNGLAVTQRVVKN